MRGRNFIYLAVAIVCTAVTVGSVFLYINQSRETTANKVAENVAEKRSVNISPGCDSLSVGGIASNAALETLNPASVPDDPQVAALRIEAQKTIDAGHLAEADALLLEVEAKRRQAFANLAVDRANSFARCAKISLIQSKYADAAKHFAQAAAVLPLGEEHGRTRLSYLDQEATALQTQSFELEDNAAAISAIARFRRLLELRPRERVPLDWARTQDNLGFALRVLGGRENGTGRLEEAVEAFHAALMEQTRERVPLDWADTQIDLGFALTALGDRENGTGRLEEAVEAFHAALAGHTREVAPLRWAVAQNGLGLALFSLGERESGTVRLEEAVQAYRAALTEGTRERRPLAWARTQDNLGIAFWRLGERESGTTALEAAIEAFHAALTEQTRERVPPQWAATQNNLSAAVKILEERKR
jgi:tetratricopeptide (TPR) repeat protein